MTCWRNLIVTLVMLLSSNAIAETYRCTDAQGSVSYTNTECQSGADVKNVKDQTNLIDYSKERQFVEQELAKARAKASGSFGELGLMNTSILVVLVLGLFAGLRAWWSRKN